MAGGLIPQERVQGCTVEKMVDEFFPWRHEQTFEVGCDV